ncbi:MAG: hypothetical protein R6W78_19090 [Bacteroidales bacterium]
MKNKSLVFSTLFISIAIVLIGLNSCDKDNLESDLNSNQELSSFTKQLTIYDEANENNLVLELSSSDQSVLNSFTDSDFEVMVIYKGESFDEAYERQYPTLDTEQEVIDETQEDLESTRETQALISIMIVEKNMQGNVQNIALTMLDKEIDERWTYPAELLSSKEQRNRTCTIRGYKSLWRAYYGIDITKTEGVGWTEFVAQWTQIKNGETHNKTSDCYQMRVWRKYRNSKAITVSFND